MEITRTTDYALRAALHLAAHRDKTAVSSLDIAREQSIPPAYVSKVLQTLARAGIVTSTRGRNGGARLRRPPEATTVLDIVEAMEGEILLNRCLIRRGECPRDLACPVHTLWGEARDDLTRKLRSVTLADLVARHRENLSRLRQAS